MWRIASCELCGNKFITRYKNQIYCKGCSDLSKRRWNPHDRPKSEVSEDEIMKCYIDHPGTFHKIVGEGFGQQIINKNGHRTRRWW